MKHRFPRIAFALLLSCFAASAADGKTPDHTAIVMVSGELPALEEDVHMFNSRSGYSASAVFSVGVKKRPDPHKEYILCHSSVKWSGGGLGLEEIYDENGEVNEWSIRVTADRASQWGAEHAVEATVFFYETLENPPPGEAHSHGLLAEASDSVTVVAPEVKIKSISFNHTPGDSAGDGIDLRESYAGPDIVAPEWTSGGNAKPVAYRAGIMPTFKVNLEISPGRLKKAKMGAKEKVSAGSGGISFVGGLSDKDVSSGTNKFNGSLSVSEIVNHGMLNWNWVVKSIEGIGVSGWNTTTSVPLYLILGKPQSPWKEGGGNQKPWISALDFVIDTCGSKKKTTPKKALAEITKSLYKKPYQSKSTCYISRADMFNYSLFTQDINVNCLDSAYGLMIGTRLLGIGTDAIKHTNVVFQEMRIEWNFHCYVCFEQNVYDSCSSVRPFFYEYPLDRYQKAITTENSEIIPLSPIPIK